MALVAAGAAVLDGVPTGLRAAGHILAAASASEAGRLWLPLAVDALLRGEAAPPSPACAATDVMLGLSLTQSRTNPVGVCICHSTAQQRAEERSCSKPSRSPPVSTESFSHFKDEHGCGSIASQHHFRSFENLLAANICSTSNPAYAMKTGNSMGVFASLH